MSPPLVEDVKACFRNHNRLVEVLRQIARGRSDGSPLAAASAARLARNVLHECSITILTGEDEP